MASKWLKSYHLNRQQFVQITNINYVHAKLLIIIKKLKSGIPHGLILGPIHFICYFKGIPQMDTNNELIFR